MLRRSRGLSRKSEGQLKNPAKVFVVAAEGAETEKIYFSFLNQYLRDLGLASIVKVEFLEREEEKRNNSSPKEVFDQLEVYYKKNGLKDNDELWCLIDRDRWPVAPEMGMGIAEIARLCSQKGYEFCVSNPCFELWLLLHHVHFADYSSQEQKKIFENKKRGNRTVLEKMLSTILATGYNKVNIVASDFMPRIEAAILEGKLLDTSTSDRWIEHTPNTRVYRLVERLITTTSRVD